MRRSHKTANRKTQIIETFSKSTAQEEILFQQGLGFHQEGQLAQAKEIYERLLKTQPEQADALNLLGLIALQTNNPTLAAKLIGKAISIKSDNADSYSNHGNALLQINRYAEAFESCNKAIALKPNHANAHFNRGIALEKLDRLDESVNSYDKAISLKQNYADAYFNRGIALGKLNRLDESLISYDKAIFIKPNFPEALYKRGNTLKELNRLDEAVISYDEAIAIDPNFFEAFYDRGNVLKELKCLEMALASFEKAIAIKPDFDEAFNNRGNTLQELRRLDAALVSYEKAIAIKPNFSEAFYNRGNALKELKRLDAALTNYDRAIAIRPDFAEAFYERGNALKELKRLDAALSSFEKAIAIKPDYDFLLGTKIHTQMHLCDWSELPNNINRIESGIGEGQKVTPPFQILGLIDNPRIHFYASKIYADNQHPSPPFIDGFNKNNPEYKIRIGYYSADFYSHATSYLMAELFESHDAEKFEIYGFSFGPNKQDEMRNRVSGCFGQFHDIKNKSDREVAKMSRDLKIDIAVDLKGFTQDSRLGLFSERCAPIQVNYLGYPGTIGSTYMDYIIADKILIPQDSQMYYSEKVVYLPHSYQANDSHRKISEKIFSKKELGLPESGFVFCCFNNNYKILPATFESWMRLLTAVGGSVLWLLKDNQTAAKNLREEAKARGVDPDRLVFADRMNLEDHLARHRAADLFIDTFPFNAHTTASDALWAGLPVLTLMGQSFASRVAASLLNALDLPELITDTQEKYESKAIDIAKDPEMLTEIKIKLGRAKKTSPLFNGILFSRHIEAAYVEMHRLHLSGKKPDHIYVNI
jgi:predicted O-linked N-acetylglucosamine transferase (SPINDLY family)